MVVDVTSKRARVGRDGFSLVEVIIAILILAFGVLGLAGTTAHITRQITLADLMTERSVAFQTIIDRLQSLPYDSVGTGQDSVGVYAIKWASTPDGAQSKIVQIVTLGPGLGSGTPPGLNAQVADTFEFRILRR